MVSAGRQSNGITGLHAHAPCLSARVLCHRAAAHVSQLLQSYRFDDIVHSLKNKYGEVPPGWDDPPEKRGLSAHSLSLLFRFLGIGNEMAAWDGVDSEELAAEKEQEQEQDSMGKSEAKEVTPPAPCASVLHFHANPAPVCMFARSSS